MTSPEMRPATPQDMAGIERWLKDEYEQLGTGQGFWNNVDILRKAADERRLFVLLISNAAFPVAFCACGRWYTSIDILEVHPDHRRQGLGRTLARHCIDQARQDGAEEITILCEPKNSVPFWKTTGFVDIDDGFGDPSGCIQMRMVLS